MVQANTQWTRLLAAFLGQPFLSVPCTSLDCKFCSTKVYEKSESRCDTWEMLLEESKLFSASCEVAQNILLSTKGSLFEVTGFCMKCQVGERQIRKTYDTISVTPITGTVDVETFLIDNNDSESRPCRQHGKDLIKVRCFGDRPQFCVMQTRKKPIDGSKKHVLPLRLEYTKGRTQTVPTPSETFFGKCYYVGNPCYRSTWSSEEAEILSTCIVDDKTFYLVKLLKYPVPDTMWNLEEVIESAPFHTGLGEYKTLQCLSSGWKSTEMIIFPPQKEKIRKERNLRDEVGDGIVLSTCIDENLIECTSVFTETPVKTNLRTRETEEEEEVVQEEEDINLPCVPPTQESNLVPKTTIERHPIIVEEDTPADNMELRGTVQTEVLYDVEEASQGISQICLGQNTSVQPSVQLATDDEVIQVTPPCGNEQNTTVRTEIAGNEHGIDSEPTGGITGTAGSENGIESKPTSIPFLYASYPVLSQLGYENSHYSEQARGGQSFQEMGSTLDERIDLCVSGVTSEEILSIDIRRDAVLGSSFHALNVTCDIDSIDLVTVPWGGMAFRGSRFRLLSMYNPSYVAKKRYLARNNNLSNFKENHNSFPGHCFLSRAIRRRVPEQRTEEDLGDPLALTVLHMKSVLSMENMKIRAIVPAGAVKHAMSGSSNLLRLFRSFLGYPNATNSTGSLATDRSTCHSLFWFMIREFIFTMLSLVSRAAMYPNCDPRLVCCAIPTSENLKFHDRERGPNSSLAAGLDLECDEMRTAFLLGARFMASLEQFSRLPSAMRSFHISDIAKYKCDENILSGVEDDEVMKCLKSDIGSEACMKFFIDQFWDGSTTFRGLVRLQSDSTRRDDKALPDMWSNKQACDSGFMVLEDLLLLAPVVFRVTEHGMKHSFKTSAKCSLVRMVLENEFSLDAVQDGITDVGFVIDGPRKSAMAVMMPRDTVYANLLVPSTLSNRTSRQLNAQFHSTCGYPEFMGLSTANGNVGVSESVLVPEKVRRVKCYSSNRRIEATRGSSVYESTGIPLEMELRNFSKIICEWMNLKPGVNRRVRLKSEEQERKRKRLFDIILHDIKRRKESVRSSDETFGVRIELTFGCNSDFSFMDEASILLMLQEERQSMSVDAFHEDFSNNPCKWPWFMHIPSNQAMTDEDVSAGFGSSTLPVTLVKTKGVIGFYTLLEEKLVQSARDVYRIACGYVSGNMEDLPERRSQFLENFIRCSSQGTGSQFAMILCRGLLAGSKLMVDALNCNVTDGSVQMQPFVLSACGLDATYCHGGIPQVILARLTSLETNFERVLRIMSPTCAEARQLMDVQQDMEGVSAYIDGDMDIPDALHLSIRKSHRGFMTQVFGRHEEAPLEGVRVEEGTEISRLSNFILSIFNTETEEERNRTMYQLATLFVLLLIQDCYNELKNMLECNPSESLSSEELSMHEKRANVLTRVDLRSVVRILARISRSNKRWPHCHSIDGGNTRNYPSSSSTIRQRMKQLLLFYNPNVDGYSPLDGDNIIDYRGTLCEEDGSIDVDKYIQSIWERSAMLPPYSELVGQENGSIASKQWKSVIALRVFEGLMECEDQRAMLISTEARRRGISGIKESFQIHLAPCIEKCLLNAGFFNICPLLIDCFPGARGELNRIWGPLPIFTVLRSTDGHLTQLCRNEGYMGSRNEQYGLDRRYMIVRKKKLRLLKRDIIDHMDKVQELQSRRPSGNEDDSSWHREIQKLAKRFWSRSNVHDSVHEYFSMFQRRKSELDLNKDSQDYCLLVLQFVLKIRREYGDEGLALFEWNETDEGAIQIRRLHDLDTAVERDLLCLKKTFPSDVDYFKKPWASLAYPKPTRTRDGRVTKKVTVRLCSRLLFESGLFFKTVTPSRNERVLSQALSLKRYTSLSVSYLYSKCRIVNTEACQSSHSMWRLAADHIVLQILVQHCTSELDKLQGI